MERRGRSGRVRAGRSHEVDGRDDRGGEVGDREPDLAVVVRSRQSARIE